MDYYRFAEELLEIRKMRSKLSYERHLSSLLKGETLVLLILADTGGILHPKEISEKLNISTARTAVILGSLEKHGYVDRITDSNDNRQILVSIKDEGRAFLKDIRERTVKFFADYLSKLDEQDVQNLIRIERKLYNENL